MITLAIILALFYTIQMLFYMVGWWRITAHNTSAQIGHNASAELIISVVIPVRDDYLNLCNCLNTVTHWGLNRTQFNVIVVNDHSEDDIDACRKKFASEHIKFIDLPEGEIGKKAALTFGIRESKALNIATIDADVIPCINWLSEMYSYLCDPKIMLCTGPVLLKEQKGFLNAFQVLDNLGLMIITGGSIALKQPLMANGANLIFKKEAFTAVDGYSHFRNQSSGDDTTLMQKIARFYGTDAVQFATGNHAFVMTNAQPYFRQMIMQRERWAGKSLGFVFKRTTVILACNYAYSLLVVTSFIILLGSGNYIPFSLLLLTKLVMDSAVVAISSIYYKQYAALGWLPLCIIAHIPYVLWTGAAGVLKPGKWKGRKINTK